MVHFKVTDGVQTRRLEAPSGLTYDDLKKKLSSMFPEAVKEDSDLVLRYRDAEGDVISLSSDQELQEALSSAGGTELKFYLPKTAANRTRHNWSPWTSFEKEVQVLVDLMDTLSRPKPSTTSSDSASADQDSAKASGPSDKNSTGAEESSQTERSEGSEEDHPQVASEATNIGEEVKSKEPSESASSKKDCHCEGYSIVGGLSPFLLRELFHPPAPRRVGYSIGYNPYCTVFC